MPILPRALPTAGPFALGRFVGDEFVVVHRRWFPAILCWVIGGVVSLWVLAGWLFPGVNYLPEPDEFAFLLSIAGAITGAGVVVVLWRRTFHISPEAIRTSAGFPGIARETLFDGETYLQIHPLKTTLKAKVTTTWNGFTVVAHTSDQDGAIFAAFAREEEAIACAERIEGESNIALKREPGAMIERVA